MIIPSEQLGQQWSLWPALGNNGLNIVRGIRVISSEIISALLVQRGELPLLWTYGIAPELFDPLSDYDARVWTYEAQQIVLSWVAGLDELVIQVEQLPDPENRLIAHILFRPASTNDQNLLTFPWHEYRGAKATDDGRDAFLDAITLNGERWTGFPVG